MNRGTQRDRESYFDDEIVGRNQLVTTKWKKKIVKAVTTELRLAWLFSSAPCCFHTLGSLHNSAQSVVQLAILPPPLEKIIGE